MVSVVVGIPGSGGMHKMDIVHMLDKQCQWWRDLGQGDLMADGVFLEVDRKVGEKYRGSDWG